jgi:hypothetical protein
MAGFQVSTDGRFSDVHRGYASTVTLETTAGDVHKTTTNNNVGDAILGDRAKPANEGQVKTGQRRMHSGH